MTASVVQDGERMLCEAAAIVEHLCHAHAGGRMTVEPGAANHYDYDYLYWIGLNNNVLRLFFTPAGPGRADRVGAGSNVSAARGRLCADD